MNGRIILSIVFLFPIIVYGKDYKVTSPDKKIEIMVAVNSTIQLQVKSNSQILFNIAEIFLELDNNVILGKNSGRMG